MEIGQMDQRITIANVIILSKLTNANTIKNPVEEIERLSKYVWKCKGHKLAKTVLKK